MWVWVGGTSSINILLGIKRGLAGHIFFYAFCFPHLAFLCTLCIGLLCIVLLMYEYIGGRKMGWCMWSSARDRCLDEMYFVSLVFGYFYTCRFCAPYIMGRAPLPLGSVI